MLPSDVQDSPIVELAAWLATDPGRHALAWEQARLDEAAELGWHQSNTEFTPDLAGVALPLPGGERLLSVVVVGPVSRCLERRPEMAAITIKHLARLK